MKIRLVILIIVCILVVQSSIIMLFMSSNYSSYKNELNYLADQQLIQINNKLSESLPVLLWNYNDSAIANNLHAELNNELLLAIVITYEGSVEYFDINQDKLKQKGLSQQQVLDSINEYSAITLTYVGDDGSGEVGELYLIADRSSVEKKLKENFKVQVYQMLIMDFVLIISIAIVMYFFVLMPINKTKLGLKNIVESKSVLNKKMRGHYIREIDDLAQYYNRLSQYVAQIVEDIQLQNDNIEAIFDNTNNALLLLDQDGEVQSANKAVKKIYNKSMDKAVEEDVYRILNDFRLLDFLKNCEKENRKTINFEMDFGTEETQFFIAVSFSKIKLGNEKAYLMVVQDVTEQNILYQEIEKALEKEQENTKLKSEFLASMSHEIRTPMNGVIGMLELMGKTDLDKQQIHYNNIARSSASSLLVIINDILDFSKIEAGKLEIEYVEFDLLNLVGEISQTLAIKAQEKGLDFWLDTSEFHIRKVIGDPVRIRQILTNLINNATKFTESGDLLVKLHPEVVVGGKVQFSCTIKDSGIGIPEDKVGSLFDSFSQVDASTTRKFGGTGLGLSIVKQLCVLMGGDVKVESVLGEGSSFTFTLMFEIVEDTTEQTSINKLTHLNVLVAEKNVIAQSVFEHYFSMLNIHERYVENLEIDYAVLKEVDFYIVDHNMIEPIEGSMNLAIKEFVKYAKKENKNIKIILVNNVSSLQEQKEIEYLGVAAQLGKPVIFEELKNCIESLHQRKQIVNVIENASLENEISHDDTHKNQQIEKNEDTNQFKHKVLLVEDNFVNQEISIALLEEMGLEVDVANNGKESLELLKKQNSENCYKMVFMDCQMPEMDGYEATNCIRRGLSNNDDIENNTIPIVAMTANAMKGDREKCIAAGMDDYISKPIDESELQGKVKKWMSN